MAKNTNNSGNAKGGRTSSSNTSKNRSRTSRSSSRNESYHTDNDYSTNSKNSGSNRSHSNRGYTSKGQQNNDDFYEDDYEYNTNTGNSSKDRSYHNEHRSNNENSTGKGGHSNRNSGYSIKPTRSNTNDDYNRNETYRNDDDYNDDSYNSGNYSKRPSNNDSSYSNDRPSKNNSHYEDEPINDPPYDDYDNEDYSNDDHYNSDNNYSDEDNYNSSNMPSKSPNNSRSRSENDYDNNQSHSNYREDERSDNNSSVASIHRVWLWAGGSVPRQAINNPRSNWWQNRASLGMTDYVIALNDHDFSNGLGIKSNYMDRRSRSGRWNPICRVLSTIDSFNISPHLMVFLPPNPELIREAAHVLTDIIERSNVAPRSIQLDLEGWWTRRSQAERQRGEQAIQRYFKDEWRGGNLELGIGVTCIGSVPGAVHGAIEKLDFVIPQIYASERNYGRPLRENSIRRHFDRAAGVINRRGKVIVGQTAYSRYVNPEIMKNMISILLRMNNSSAGNVREIAYWSDIHLLNSRTNRDFFQRMTGMVRGEGLNLNTINRL